MHDNLLRVRIEPDVLPLIEKSAAKDGRSIPKEVNIALREFYSARNSTVVMNLNMIPPTYWTKKQRASYLRTGIYPGTENDTHPVVHSVKQRHGHEFGGSTFVETIKRRRMRSKR